MAVSATNLTFGSSATDASSYSTASVAPGSNRLILASITSRTGITADPNQPTATGNGLTWVVVNSVVYDTTSSSRRRVTTLRAMGSSPSSGAITFDFGGQTQTSVSWAVDEFTGMDTTGTNGSGAIVQSVTNTDEAASGALTVTLAAFSDSNNATFGAFAEAATFSFTPGSGFTTLGADTGDAEAGNQCNTEWKSTNDTSVDCTWGGAVTQVGGIAIEIKAFTAAAETTIRYITTRPTWLS